MLHSRKNLDGDHRSKNRRRFLNKDYGSERIFFSDHFHHQLDAQARGVFDVHLVGARVRWSLNMLVILLSFMALATSIETVKTAERMCTVTARPRFRSCSLCCINHIL